MVRCSLLSAILLSYRKKDSNYEAMYPVSSAQIICRIAAIKKPGKKVNR